MPMHVMVVFGTRPEAIKMAPVVRALRAESSIRTTVCVTAQHREMLDQALQVFGITPDIDLDLMRAAQSLTDLSGTTIMAMGEVYRSHRPDWVLVHGDTATTLSASIAAFYEKVRVGHVEAGLRTYDMTRPWPEEMHRRVVGAVTSLHFAPTAAARDHLLREGVADERIEVTGNTAIDALLEVVALLRDRPEIKHSMESRFPFLDEKPMILVTGHRRENIGGGLAGVCAALREIVQRNDVRIVYPVHRNPAVVETAQQILADVSRVHLIEPADYLDFVYLMTRSHLIITDSGGIQEEAPSLGKPVLVTRDVTERPEAVAAGAAELVGTDPQRIIEATTRLLEDTAHYRRMSEALNPFGDGLASERIVRRLLRTETVSPSLIKTWSLPEPS